VPVAHAKLLAVLLFVSGTFLLYTVIMAPVQIFVWEFNETECNLFPTLYFDMFVDMFFMVKFMQMLSIQVSNYMIYSQNPLNIMLLTIWI
jgi:hypothetical protein